MSEYIQDAAPGVPIEPAQRLKLMTTVTDNNDALLIVSMMFYERHYYYTAEANGCAGTDPLSGVYNRVKACHRRVK